MTSGVTARRIVLVDPSDRRDTLAERLRMQGYQVTVTASPVEGAAMALADPPAAFVTDLWTPRISGVQICRLLRAELATERVPVILRGPENDNHSRFWAEQAGAAAYVGLGRMGELVRALASATVANPAPEDAFMLVCSEESDIRDRIAAHLDAALFDSVIASEVRALSVCGNLVRLFDLLSQFVSRVTTYRWLAIHVYSPEWLGLHTHPLSRGRAEEEARVALGSSGEQQTGPSIAALAVEDEDACDDATGGPPILRPIRLGTAVIGAVALAPRREPHPKDAELVSILARELVGPIRIAALVEEAERLATTDSLTALMNRRSFTAAALREVARSQRHGHPMCLLVLDLDHFKAINDQRGHPAGDAVLTAIGRLLRSSIRSEDFAGRWGGEEFVVALVGSDESGGFTAAERLRVSIAELQVPDGAGKVIPVTTSIGLAAYRPGDGVDTLVRRADEAMYIAKTSGRNRVAVASAGDTPARAHEPPHQNGEAAAPLTE